LIAVVRTEPESSTTLPETMRACSVFVFSVKPFTTPSKLRFAMQEGIRIELEMEIYSP
jgi:hypothetical protein